MLQETSSLAQNPFANRSNPSFLKLCYFASSIDEETDLLNGLVSEHIRATFFWNKETSNPLVFCETHGSGASSLQPWYIHVSCSE